MNQSFALGRSLLSPLAGARYVGPWAGASPAVPSFAPMGSLALVLPSSGSSFRPLPPSALFRWRGLPRHLKRGQSSAGSVVSPDSVRLVRRCSFNFRRLLSLLSLAVYTCV